MVPGIGPWASGIGHWPVAGKGAHVVWGLAYQLVESHGVEPHRTFKRLEPPLLLARSRRRAVRAARAAPAASAARAACNRRALSTSSNLPLPLLPLLRLLRLLPLPLLLHELHQRLPQPPLEQRHLVPPRGHQRREDRRVPPLRAPPLGISLGLHIRIGTPSAPP